MKKLLLVDDNRDFLQILSIALEKDFEVYKADGLSQALKVLDTVPINAICSDFYMRDGTGHRFRLDKRDTMQEYNTSIFAYVGE